MERPFAAYSGDGPYIFVSYAHEDSALVYPELVRLRGLGFNVWYDEGISPGSSWRQELADAIQNAGLFLFFVSPKSTASPNCQKEVNFGIDSGKPFIAVHLVKTELSTGMQLTLSDIQAVMKHELRDEDYQRKLLDGIGATLTPDARVSHSPAPAQSVDHKTTILIAGGLIAVAIVAGAFMLRTPSPTDPVTADTRGEGDMVPAESLVATAPEEDHTPSIVVLPFDNQSADVDNAFFTSGIFDDIISNLSKIPGLKVISRTSALRFEAGDRSPAEIGAELGVNHILEGSVRRAGNQVRIVVQLIETDSDTNLWSEIYDRDLVDIFEIQSEVAEAVAQSLSIALDVEVRSRIKAKPVDPRAYDLYLKARAMIDQRRYGWDLINPGGEGHLAVELLEAALAIDEFGLAYAALADAYEMSGVGQWSQVRSRCFAAAERALELAPDTPEAQFAMAKALSMTAERRYSDSFRYYERARELNPNDARIMWRYGISQIWAGNINAALAQWQNIIEVDPLSAEANIAQADALGSAGDLDSARAHVRRALQIEPNSVFVHRAAAFTYGRIDDRVNQIDALMRAHRMDTRDAQPIFDLVGFLIELEAYDSAERWIGVLDPLSKPLADVRRGWLYNAMGDAERYLEVAPINIARFPNDRIVQTGEYLALQFQAIRAKEQEDLESSYRYREQALAQVEALVAPDMVDGELRVQLDNLFQSISYAT